MDHFIRFLVDKDIRHATTQSSAYGDLRPVFIVDEATVPAVIVRPRSAEEVAAVVTCLRKTKVPFSVRGGGHDMFGRSQIHDGVTIDMRDIAHADVSPDSQTARVGGGIISMDMLRKLQRQGVTVPHPATPTVGFVGWAIYGGYGLLSTQHGLGVDQIVGAKVVDAQGRLGEADESMLTAIRGAGGLVGVIVELTIKVYPIDQILAGMIFFDSADLPATIRQYSDNYEKAAAEGISSSLSIERFVVNGPTGKTFLVFFLWTAPDLEEGHAWLSKVSSWAPVAMSTVAPTTISDFNEAANAIVPRQAHGSMFSLNFKRLTAEIVDVVAKHAVLQPMNPEVILGVHEIRAEASLVEQFPTSFNLREPHFLIEIVPITSAAEGVAEVNAWAQRLFDALMATNQTNILGRYIPFTPTKDIDLGQVYGDRLETLKRIKREYDPDNVFQHALVKL